jgi:putative addiction module component (TIGR02574 family)
MSQSLSEFQKLPLHERLQLVEDLWDSIASEQQDLLVPEWQKEELDRRAKDFAENPPCGIPWDTAIEVIRGNLSQKNHLSS